MNKQLPLFVLLVFGFLSPYIFAQNSSVDKVNAKKIIPIEGEKVIVFEYNISKGNASDYFCVGVELMFEGETLNNLHLSGDKGCKVKKGKNAPKTFYWHIERDIDRIPSLRGTSIDDINENLFSSIDASVSSEKLPPRIGLHHALIPSWGHRKLGAMNNNEPRYWATDALFFSPLIIATALEIKARIQYNDYKDAVELEDCDPAELRDMLDDANRSHRWALGAGAVAIVGGIGINYSWMKKMQRTKANDIKKSYKKKYKYQTVFFPTNNGAVVSLNINF